MNTVPASSPDLSVAAAFQCEKSRRLAGESILSLFWVFDPRNGRLLHASPTMGGLSDQLGCDLSGDMRG